MLVIGFNSDNNSYAAHELDLDAQDAPNKVYKALKRASKDEDFTLIVCVEDGEEVASYTVNEDFDPEDDEDEDDDTSDDLDDEDDDVDDDDDE